MSNKTKGVIAAMVAAIAYGLNPFFALPLYEEGLTVDSVIFYRYGFSAIILAIILLMSKQSFSISHKEGFTLVLLGVLFSGSSIFLFDSFNYIDAGIACTILFIYPVMVALVMAVFFKERLLVLTYCCIALTVVGIILLYNGGETSLSTKGIILVILSALSFSAYIVIVNKSCVSTINPIKLTFWATLFGAIVVAVKLNMLTNLQPIENSRVWLNILGIAIVPTVISMILIAIAIVKIGSTNTSIIGALEPITALIVGVIIYDEIITLRIAIGVFIIIGAVTFVIAGKQIMLMIKSKRNL